MVESLQFRVLIQKSISRLETPLPGADGRGPAEPRGNTHQVHGLLALPVPASPRPLVVRDAGLPLGADSQVLLRPALLVQAGAKQRHELGRAAAAAAAASGRRRERGPAYAEHRGQTDGAELAGRSRPGLGGRHRLEPEPREVPEPEEAPGRTGEAEEDRGALRLEPAARQLGAGLFVSRHAFAPAKSFRKYKCALLFSFASFRVVL